MSLQIVRATPDQVPELSRIIFEAFRGIHQRHNFPLDVPSLELGTLMAGMLTGRPDFYGVTAIQDGKIVGSNFVQISDEVAGIGPITVDPICQSRGVGRALMQNIVDWALKNHGPMVRLMQDGFNMASLSLYTSMGFAVVEPIALMELEPAERVDASVRPLTCDDLPACDALCRRVIKVSRKNELRFFIEHGSDMGFVPHGRFKAGQLAAYVVPGFLGHAVAESTDDFLVAITQAARNAPAPARKVFLPVRNNDLFRQALKRQMRVVKLMSLMALGPYEDPMLPSTGAAWSPSIEC
ncbi:MAG: GNAT family N-acetyltransferase [Tepidisphaeraceae bacterium]|jgi:GNAT superfamily N-acetyltransferase